jgi:DNA gyrase subunit A
VRRVGFCQRNADAAGGGDKIVSVAIARPTDDVVLTTARGQCIRFLIGEEVRLFKGRDSDGVRGTALK